LQESKRWKNSRLKENIRYWEGIGVFKFKAKQQEQWKHFKEENIRDNIKDDEWHWEEEREVIIGGVNEGNCKQCVD
jgi:hypothetical protein